MSPHDDARVPPQPRPNRGHQPSFSAALLDAIYHSLEAEPDADAAARPSTEARQTPASPAQRTPVSSRHRRPAPALSPSASSVRSPRLQMPPRPCRVRPDPQPSSILLPPPAHESAGPRPDDKKQRATARRSKKAAKKKKTKVAPFACLLNALLCNRRPARPAGHTPRATAAAFPAPEPASARSILSSRASRRASAAAGGSLTPARRAVRFSPVAVVVDDERGGGGGVVGTATRLRDVEMEMVQAKESAAEAERRVEELLRALGVVEERERERAKESSESSSDLFELDSLPARQDSDVPPRAGAAAGAGMARPRPRVQ